jgi:DNA-binding CsgD family transcriptional regulator
LAVLDNVTFYTHFTTPLMTDLMEACGARGDRKMAKRSLLKHALSILDAASTVDDLRGTVSHIRDCYHLSHLVFHVVSLGSAHAKHPMILLTYAQEWVDFYINQNFFDIDPVVNLSRTGFLPVDWSLLDHGSFETVQFFRQAHSFGVGRFGLTIPVRGPQGERSLFSATSNLRESAWRHLCADCMNDLQILSHYLHEKALTTSGLRDHGSVKRLSRRELQCINMVAHGWLVKQIAAELQLSESAVRLYLRMAKRKLGVSTTYQAIGRAVAGELIHV